VFLCSYATELVVLQIIRKLFICTSLGAIKVIKIESQEKRIYAPLGLGETFHSLYGELV